MNRNETVVRNNLNFLVTEDETDFIENTDIFIMSYVYNELNREEKNIIYQKISHLASKHFLLIVNDYDGAGHTYFLEKLFGGFDYENFGFEKINSGGWNCNKKEASFKSQVKSWCYTNLNNISFRDRYAMKVNMKSICYIFEFKRIEK